MSQQTDQQTDERASRPSTYVGTSQRPHDWAARTDGSTLFAADLRMSALRAAVLRSPHPYAEIVSLDTSRA